MKYCSLTDDNGRAFLNYINENTAIDVRGAVLVSTRKRVLFYLLFIIYYLLFIIYSESYRSVG